MSDATIFSIGITCVAVCVALGWYCLSTTALRWRMRRLGLEPDVTIGQQPEEVIRHLDRQRLMSYLFVLSGITGALLIWIVWPDSLWLVTGGFLGWTAWMLNQIRIGNRLWRTSPRA